MEQVQLYNRDLGALDLDYIKNFEPELYVRFLELQIAGLKSDLVSAEKRRSHWLKVALCGGMLFAANFIVLFLQSSR